MNRIIILFNAIKNHFKQATVPLKVHDRQIKEKNDIIDQRDKTIMLLTRQVIALEKDIEFNIREKLIDQSFIVDLLAFTNIPEANRIELERKVDKQKAFIRRFYGRKHPDDKYNQASIQENDSKP